MPKLLVSWIGKTDLNASLGIAAAGFGPIAPAFEKFEFARAVFLSNYPEKESKAYIRWLKKRSEVPLELRAVQLSSPMNFGEIYEAVVQTIDSVTQAQRGTPHSGLELYFHISPGTSAMAAVWIILSKTRFPATLIQSSKEKGVEVFSVPLDISADFIPDLLHRPDRRLERLTAGLPPEAPEFDDIIHRSGVMKRVIAKARRVAPRSVPVLIEGATGTGKELLARAIHEASPRRDRPFVAVNCGAIPSELVESELFGHEKGAFTGADRRRKGYFEVAEGGTLLLDEVGELPMAAQVKLLRVLQEREILRLGETKPITIDVRIIAATNRTLAEEVTAGRFREDLFYRLAVAVLKLPPLCERPGDLSPLIDHLLEGVNNESQQEPGYENKKLSAGARNLLLNHDWPGNVRELYNTIRRAAIWSAGAVIDEEDVREALLPPLKTNQAGVLNRPLGEGLKLQEIMALVARHYLQRAIEETHGNKTKAADLIGLPNYQTLTNWLKKYGVNT